jgi:hypothetical protein
MWQSYPDEGASSNSLWVVSREHRGLLLDFYDWIRQFRRLLHRGEH